MNFPLPSNINDQRRKVGWWVRKTGNEGLWEEETWERREVKKNKNKKINK